MRKKRACTLLCVTLVIGMVVTVAVVVSLNSTEIVTGLTVQNQDGATGTVFVVYRPDFSGFNEDVVNSYISGLVESDWRVEMTTCSTQTPTNVTDYDVIVLSAPTRGGMPHEHMFAYLGRVDFDGKQVVLILTSGGTGEDSIQHFRNATTEANGVIHSEHLYQVFSEDATQLAYTAGTELVLP